MTQRIPKPAKPTVGTQRSFVTEVTKETIEKSHEDKIMFSFMYFDKEHKAFNCGNTQPGWFLHVLENIKHISNLSRIEFEVHQRQHYRVHKIDFKSRPFSFDTIPLGQFAQIEDECYQFRLSSGGGRVHGFMIRNKFYVVWLDPHHNLYPDDRYGGITEYSAPPTPYEILEEQCDRLQKEIDGLHLLLDEKTAPGA